MNKRELKLKKNGISNKRYKELRGFCEQYPEWLDYLEEHEYPIKGVTYSDMPKAQKLSDTTFDTVTRCAIFKERCELIEQTAIEASSDLYQYILKSVCYGTSFIRLQTVEEVPCSRTAFYDKRRFFFYLLDRKKKM